MRRKVCAWHIALVFSLNLISSSFCAMTQKQLEKSMDMMRSTCQPKFPSLTKEILDGFRKGVGDDNNKDLKCYTLCIAQMAGTMTKKNEIHYEKTVKQLEAMTPTEIKTIILDAYAKCKDVQKQYKDPCDKTYFSAKCGFELEPQHWTFP